MAASFFGNSRASAVTICCNDCFFTVATCTVTTGCGSGCSLEQLLRTSTAIEATLRRTCVRSSLEVPRERLKIGDRRTVPSRCVREVVLRQQRRILRVHNFECRSLADLVPEYSKAKAFSGKVCGLLQQINLNSRGLSLIIEKPQI